MARIRRRGEGSLCESAEVSSSKLVCDKFPFDTIDLGPFLLRRIRQLSLVRNTEDTAIERQSERRGRRWGFVKYHKLNIIKIYISIPPPFFSTRFAYPYICTHSLTFIHILHPSDMLLAPLTKALFLGGHITPAARALLQRRR